MTQERLKAGCWLLEGRSRDWGCGAGDTPTGVPSYGGARGLRPRDSQTPASSRKTPALFGAPWVTLSSVSQPHPPPSPRAPPPSPLPHGPSRQTLGWASLCARQGTRGGGTARPVGLLRTSWAPAAGHRLPGMWTEPVGLSEVLPPVFCGAKYSSQGGEFPVTAPPPPLPGNRCQLH